MTTARRKLINVNTTQYYHCITNCVRRAFLAGFDSYSGKDYEERRQWIEDKMFELVDVFSIDICAYAIMNNHYHIVFHIDKEKAIGWTFSEIFEHWGRLHKLDELAERYLSSEEIGDAEQLVLAHIAAEYRERLMSISWFMRELNQDIAKRANKEDGCKGKFWEARFKSQALLDEAALLACMAYVDLNPIRSGLCSTPEQSDHTSIQIRIRQILHGDQSNKKLMCFRKSQIDQNNKLPIAENDYFALVDWTGRIERADKKGAITKEIPHILTRLGLEQDEWLGQARYFEDRFKCVAGAWHCMQKAARDFKKHWFQGKLIKKLTL